MKPRCSKKKTNKHVSVKINSSGAQWERAKWWEESTLGWPSILIQPQLTRVQDDTEINMCIHFSASADLQMHLNGRISFHSPWQLLQGCGLGDRTAPRSVIHTRHFRLCTSGAWTGLHKQFFLLEGYKQDWAKKKKRLRWRNRRIIVGAWATVAQLASLWFY